MTRIIVQKDGVITDVPENELTHFLQLGYEQIGTAPDAPPIAEQKPTPEEDAVNDALLKVVEAEKELVEAENANIAARSSTLSTKATKTKAREKESNPAEPKESWDEMTVVELRREVALRGLNAASSNKAELVEILEQSEKEKAAKTASKKVG